MELPGDAAADWYPDVPPEAGPEGPFGRDTVEPDALAEVRLEEAESFRGDGSSMSRGARGWCAEAAALCTPLRTRLAALEALWFGEGLTTGRARIGF